MTTYCHNYHNNFYKLITFNSNSIALTILIPSFSCNLIMYIMDTNLLLVP